VEDEFARSNRYINGIESFWSFIKRHFAQFNGIQKQKSYFYLKEIQFQFNHRNNKGGLA